MDYQLSQESIMTIRVREFDIRESIAKIRKIGSTTIADRLGNKICAYGSPNEYRPCFRERQHEDKTEPLTISQVACWPLMYKGWDGPNGCPPNGCHSCCDENADNCFGKVGHEWSCIFSVCKPKVIRPQFVFIGKNWSSSIAAHDVNSICWGDGHDIQVKYLRETIFEGGYFTDFVKGVSKTYFQDMASWLKKTDPELGGRRRFDVYLEVLLNELKLLEDNFDLTGVNRYIVIWGIGILDALNAVSQHLYRCDFAQLDGIRDRFKVRLFGCHYSPQGYVIRSLPKPKDINTALRIYENIGKCRDDYSGDQERFEFRIGRGNTIQGEKVEII